MARPFLDRRSAAPSLPGKWRDHFLDRAHGAALHWREPGGYNRRALLSILAWGLALPFSALTLAWPTHGSSLSLLALYGVLAWRIRAYRLRLGDERGHAMRYGQPSVAGVLDELKAANATRILVLPLYPQYAAATTASVTDAVMAWMLTQRHQPELRFVNRYHDDAGYIAARLSGENPVTAAAAGHRLAAQKVRHRGAIMPRNAAAMH